MECLDSSPWSRNYGIYIRTPEYNNSGITTYQLCQDVQAFLVALICLEVSRVPLTSEVIPICYNLSLANHTNLRCSLLRMEISANVALEAEYVRTWLDCVTAATQPSHACLVQLLSVCLGQIVLQPSTL